MLEKVRDEKIPLGLKKIYTEHIVSYYLYSETRALIKNKQPDLAQLSDFHALIQSSDTLLETFNQAFEKLKGENERLAEVRRKTPRVEGYNVHNLIGEK